MWHPSTLQTQRDEMRPGAEMVGPELDMKPAPSRFLQIVCAMIAVIGFAPWALVFAGAVLGAIESRSPLVMSFAAWLVLLIPIWVIWFAIVAWRDRDVSAKPAVLMALPGALCTVLAMTTPYLALVP